MDLDPVLVDAAGFGGGHPRVLGRLGARPHVERPVVPHPADGVVRLHGRMGEIRDACRSRRSSSAPGRTPGRRRRRRVTTTARSPVSSSRRCSSRSSSELRRSVFVSSHSTVSARRPRCASANVSPTTATPSSISTTAITPGSAQGRLVVDRSNRRTEPGRVQHDSGHHPGEDRVDREPGPAEDLRGRVDTQPSRVPDERVVRRILELDMLGYRQPLGRRGQFAERRLPAVPRRATRRA